MPRAHLAAAAALALAVACKEPTVPHPLANQFRYTCCNLHYEKPEITDANYLRGTLIPFGTRIQILEVRKDSVTFKAAGHPPITLTLRDGARSLTLDQYLDRVFPPDDPYARLPKLPPDGKQAAEADKTRTLIEQGTVTFGMSRDQPRLALGCAPAHGTAGGEAP